MAKAPGDKSSIVSLTSHLMDDKFLVSSELGIVSFHIEPGFFMGFNPQPIMSTRYCQEIPLHHSRCTET